MNNDLIRRSDAVEILRARAEMANVGTPKLVFDAASRMIDRMPAVDAVQVVRCRDCKCYAENDYEILYDVTHWMPLPDAPEVNA